MMKINGEEISLYEENKLDNLIKTGLVTTAVASAFFLSPVPMQAAGWKANSPEQIASRIDYSQRSLTFESGDTVWNLGEALNIKNPMDLLTYNNYQPGDEYILPVGTVIYWDDGHLIIEDPEGTVIGDKVITEQDKKNPSQPIPLEIQEQRIVDQDQQKVAHSDDIVTINKDTNAQHPEFKQENTKKTEEDQSNAMKLNSEDHSVQMEQAQQRINYLLSKKETIELEIERVKSDIKEIEEDIENQQNLNLAQLDQYMARDQELSALQTQINDHITYQLNPKKEELARAIKEEAKVLEEYEQISSTFKSIQDQLQELEVQEQVATIAIQQLKDQLASFPITEDNIDEFMQRKSDYEYQLSLKSELEKNKANLMVQFLEYEELSTEYKLLFEGKKSLVSLLQQEVSEHEHALTVLEQQYDHVDLGYQQQKIEVQELALDPLLQQLEDKRNLLIRLETKLATINKELNDLYVMYRPAGVHEEQNVHTSSPDPIVDHDTISQPELDTSDPIKDQEDLFISDHETQEEDALDSVSNDPIDDKDLLDNNSIATPVMNEQQLLDALNELFDQNKLTVRQYRESVRFIQDAATLEAKQQEFERIEAIAEANGKQPHQISKEVFVQLLNDYRQELGLSQLKVDPTLTAAAEIRANEITQKFDHYRPDGSLFNTVVEDHQSVVAYSENIAIAHSFDNNGVEIAEYLFDAWQDSPGHDKNLRTRNNTRIGFAYAQGADGNYYAVLLFGTLKN